MSNLPELPAKLLDSPNRNALYDFWQNDALLVRGAILGASEDHTRLLASDTFRDLPVDMQKEHIEFFDTPLQATTQTYEYDVSKKLTDLIYYADKLPDPVVATVTENNEWWDERLDSQRPALDAWLKKNMPTIGNALIDQYSEYGVPRDVLERRFFDDNGDVRLDVLFMGQKQYEDTIILSETVLEIPVDGSTPYADLLSGIVCIPNSSHIIDGNWMDDPSFVHSVFHEAAHMLQGAVIQDLDNPTVDVIQNLTTGIGRLPKMTSILTLEWITDVVASEAKDNVGIFDHLEGEVDSYYTQPYWQDKAAPLLELPDFIPAAIRTSVIDFNPRHPDIYFSAHEKLGNIIKKALTR